MMCSNLCNSPNPLSSPDSDCSSVNLNVQALNMTHFTEDMASRQQKYDEETENPKHTMQSLCKSFIKKYENSGLLFEPSTLANDFNAKLRRVYDMTNILEGGRIIEKVGKGIYKWSNQDNEDNEIQREKNDWFCLRNISSQLKELFQCSDKGLTCHEIYCNLTSKRKGKFNPVTIRRRIYECCKVFLIAGLIQKVGKSFYNAKLTQQDIQLLATKKYAPLQQKTNMSNFTKMEQQLIGKSSPKKSIKQTENSSEDEMKKPYKRNEDRKTIIRKIVGQLRNEQELMNFIEDLTLEFKIKTFQTTQSSKNSKIDEQCQFLSPNNYSWIQNRRIGFVKRRESEEPYFSPQINRRTIIISSPLKDKVPFMFSPNSSFCSLPSNTNFDNLCNIKPLFDIKGK